MHDSKLSILFLYSSTGYGGMVTNLAKIINSLDRNKFNVYLASLENNNPCAELLDTHLETKTMVLACNGRLDFRLIGEIRTIIKQHKIQILNADGYKADFYAIISTFGLTLKKITILHGWVSQTLLLRLYQCLDKFLFFFFDKIILLSPAQFKRHPFLRLLNSKISIIPNGINIDVSIDRNKKNLRKLEDIFCIGTCSRLAPEKDVSTLLRACAELTNVNWKLVIVGSGEEAQKLQNLAQHLGIADKVQFLGYQKDIINLMKDFDVFVSCSQIEGFPNTLLEAASLALPVIVSNIPEHSYIIKDQENGLHFKLQNPEDLQEKLLRVATESDFSNKLGLNLQKTVATNFSLKQRTKLLEDFYLKALC